MNLSDYKDCVILGLHDETEGLRTDYIICVIVLKTTGLTNGKLDHGVNGEECVCSYLFKQLCKAQKLECQYT